MAKKASWHDDYWLLLIQLYLRKPVGVKPTYSRDMVQLCLELHIGPQQLQTRMQQLARLQTPRIMHYWDAYAENPRRLARAVRLLRSMKGFGAAEEFYEGVEIQETFEKDFRPLAENEHLMPVTLILILNLYFHLTPLTMVAETPEVQELARMTKVRPAEVEEVLEVFQHCDPYLNKHDVATFNPLLLPCSQVWQRFGNEPEKLEAMAEELKAYFA